MDSKAVPQTIETNPASSTWIISSKLVIFTTFAKSPEVTELGLTLSKDYKTFDLP